MNEMEFQRAVEGFFRLSKVIAGIEKPELVIGIAGPIGIDIDALSETLIDQLKSVGYQSKTIRITDEIASISTKIKRPRFSNYHSEIRYKMQHASELCRKYKDESYLMRIAIDAIQRERSKIVKEMSIGGKLSKASAQKIPESISYIIRQIKRPKEVELMREVYGKQFILVSAYGDEKSRKHIIEEKLKRTMSLGTKPNTISSKADELIHIDADEADDNYGQHMRDAFHLADVFVDGIDRRLMKEKVERFIAAFFGLNEIAPSKAEYGMYAAKGASLRSSDLSRQVGAAIFTKDGELLTQGCNEVPRAFGGTYWDGETPDFRDIKIGSDPNDIIKREVLRDLLERLAEAKMLNSAVRDDPTNLVERLTRPKSNTNNGLGAGCLKGAMVTELTEYGRVVHAEMNAVCDAARRGIALKGATLYCTTFPCHNCTKHIIASGITRVVFMEPYPKSKAKELHENEIEIEVESSSKVSFIPFLGISPFRYRDIFQKGSRKSSGKANKWYFGEPRPMVDIIAPNYTDLENVALVGLIGEVTRPS